VIDSVFAVKAIVCMAAVTIFLRTVPFIGTGHLHKFPLLLSLGRFLPPAIMTLLLLHTLRGSMTEHTLGIWPELLAAAMALLLQWHTRQPFLSIFTATALYVVLRNTLV